MVNLAPLKSRMSHAAFRQGNARRLPVVDDRVEVVISDGVVSL
jgi:hypothetical protein